MSSEFTAALAGAVVGGVLGGGGTFAASWWQTKRMLEHERLMATRAAENERLAAREELMRTTATEVLALLSNAEQTIDRVAAGGHLYMGSGDRVNADLEALRVAHVSALPLLPEPLRHRFGAFRHLLAELGTATSAGSLGPVIGATWTDEKIARARLDLLGYLAYLRRSLVALIDGADLPADLPAPVLRRQDMSVWQPPDAAPEVP